jgi:hypothetical protein
LLSVGNEASMSNVRAREYVSAAVYLMLTTYLFP